MSRPTTLLMLVVVALAAVPTGDLEPVTPLAAAPGSARRIVGLPPLPLCALESGSPDQEAPNLVEAAESLEDETEEDGLEDNCWACLSAAAELEPHTLVLRQRASRPPHYSLSTGRCRSPRSPPREI